MPRKTSEPLTDLKVRQTKPSNTRKEIRDADCPGLVLRVTPSGCRTFTFHGRSLSGRTCQITLGQYPAISLKEARELAWAHRAALAQGRDPREEKQRAKAQEAASRVTLVDILREAEAAFGPTRVVWRVNERYGRSKPEASSAIENVFKPLLRRPIAHLTPKDFSDAMKSYKPLRPRAGKTTATGSVSRALAYLRPVMDWAAGRDRYAKEGAGRVDRLDVADLSTLHDPSLDDPTLEVRRERALHQSEMEAVLPLLTYPAPAGLRKRLPPEDDYGPAAMLFLFLTMSRRDEVSSARKMDIDLVRKIWTKEVKTKHKRGAGRAGARRIVTIPLSDAAIALLKTLPSVRNGKPEDLVFPSSGGGRLGNWDRTQKALHEMSGTQDWHRHDLRRTGASILHQFNVSPAVVDELLCHVSPLQSSNVSEAAPVYMLRERIIEQGPDPLREAVELLARVLQEIAPLAFGFIKNSESDAAREKHYVHHLEISKTEDSRTRSPWAAATLPSEAAGQFMHYRGPTASMQISQTLGPDFPE